MFKIIYLPTTEIVKISPDLKVKDISIFLTDNSYSFVNLGKYIIVSNREPDREPLSKYAYKAIPKYYFDIIEVSDV